MARVSGGVSGHDHRPPVAAILIILVMLLAGLSGCIDPDPDSLTYSALRRDLDIQVERYLATDHFWQSDGPHTTFNEDDLYLFVLVRMLNTGDSDLSVDDLHFFAYFSEDSGYYSPYLLALGGFSLEEDPRMWEGHLDTINASIPADGTMEGWLWFTTDNSTLMDGEMQLKISHIFDERVVMRRDFSLGEVEVDWGIPPMVTVDEEHLTYTDMNMGSWVDYGERFFVADLSLVDNWPVDARIDPEDIFITDAQGVVHEPETIGGRTPRDADPIEFNGSYQLKVAFLITSNEVPVSLSLAEDPPMELKIDPGSIIEDKYPSRVDLTVNFFFQMDKNDRSFLIYNVTLNNPSPETVNVNIWNFHLLDSEGTLHDIRWGPGTTVNELEEVDLGPGDGITGDVPFNYLEGLEPVSLVYKDGASYLENPLGGVVEFKENDRPRFTFEIEAMNITIGSGWDPWTEFFNVSLEVRNLLPFEVPLRYRNFTLYDREGKVYKPTASRPADRNEIARHHELGPGERISGFMRFTVQNESILTRLEYDDEGEIYSMVFDHDDIEVLPREPSIFSIFVKSAFYTNRIDDHVAENGSHFLVLKITFRNLGSEDFMFSSQGPLMYDVNRESHDQVEAVTVFRSYDNFLWIPPGNRTDTFSVFEIAMDTDPLYLSYMNDRWYTVNLFDLDIQEVQMFPRLNVTLNSMTYMDHVDGLENKSGHRYLVIHVTVTGQWPEVVRTYTSWFWLLNVTGERVNSFSDAKDLFDSYWSSDLAFGDEVSGNLYYHVPIGYEPVNLFVQVSYGDQTIPIDPGPA